MFEVVPGQKTRAKRIDGHRLNLPDGYRYWFTARTIAGDFDVILANEHVCPALNGLVAVTLADQGIIACDEDMTLSRIVVGLIHELLGHGVLNAPGDVDLNAHLFGCSAKKADVIEERLVTHMAPRWAHCLIHSGLLRLPPIPRRRKSA